MNADSFATIADVGRKLRNGERSPLDLVDLCLERIDAAEDRLEAWVRVDREGARREADRLGKMLAEGEDLGPLHGIPIGIKDIVDVQGMNTEAGSKLLQGRMAEQDAPVVARLRAAGAIILGKTATTEFACFDPCPTRNPWNLDHTPGGSSSGSAAAVAAGMCYAALGSQTGGSITRPAAYCGVAGIKPTFGRVDVTGVVPISQRLDHLGALARTADDLDLVFRLMTDTTESPTVDAPPDLHFIGEYFLETADEIVRNATVVAFDKLRAAGANFAELKLPPSFRSVAMMHRTIMAVEAAEMHCDTFAKHADDYGPQISKLLEEGLSSFAVDYCLALRHYELFRQDMDRAIAGSRVAITPATPTVAPAGLESTGDPRFNSPWSHAGLPTVAVPCGMTSDDLPVGLQLIGARGQDERLLKVAAWCEGVLRPDSPAVPRI